MNRTERKAVRAEIRAASTVQEQIYRQMLADGIDWETPEWLDANDRTDAACRVLEATRPYRMLNAATSLLLSAVWLAVCFIAAGATIDWLGTGVWARIFAASNFLTLWLLPDGMPEWLAKRVFREMREAPDA